MPGRKCPAGRKLLWQRVECIQRVQVQGKVLVGARANGQAAMIQRLFIVLHGAARE